MEVELGSGAIRPFGVYTDRGVTIRLGGILDDDFRNTVVAEFSQNTVLGCIQLPCPQNLDGIGGVGWDEVHGAKSSCDTPVQRKSPSLPFPGPPDSFRPRLLLLWVWNTRHISRAVAR